MPGCILKISGTYRDLVNVLAKSPIPFVESSACASERKRGKITKASESMFYAMASEADGDHVPVQVEEAESFVRQNSDELERIFASDGITCGSLDFGWDVSLEALAPYNIFSVGLMRVCGELGISLIIRLYPEREGEP